ncbi:MAG: hypothetical protein AB1813_06680 [Verrucomicrobiota bacterium]
MKTNFWKEHKHHIIPPLAGVVLGMIGLPITHENEDNLWYWLTAPALVAFACEWFLRSRWPGQVGVTLVLGIVAGLFLSMIPGWLRDSTANNLWPLALFFVFVFSLMPALLGSIVAAILRRKHEPVP